MTLALSVAAISGQIAVAQSGSDDKSDFTPEAGPLPRLEISVTDRALALEYFLQWQGSFTVFEFDDWDAPLESARPVHAGRSPYMRQGKFMLPKPANSKPHFYFLAEIPNPLPQQMVWIPAGTFQMGSPELEKGRFMDEGPQRLIRIAPGFWMSKHEVTQAEYQAVTGANPSKFNDDPNRPVETLSWDMANDYCARLTSREHAESRLPLGYVYRLPTEAEWEYACRAGTYSRFSYGDDLDYQQLPQHGWFAYNANFMTHPVGKLKPNEWGLYDMHGNVFEWCLDWYELYPDENGPRPGKHRYHTIRGGSWICDAIFLRSAARHNDDVEATAYTGFRVVLAPPQS